MPDKINEQKASPQREFASCPTLIVLRFSRFQRSRLPSACAPVAGISPPAAAYYTKGYGLKPRVTVTQFMRPVHALITRPTRSDQCHREIAIDFLNPVLLYYLVTTAKARVTGMRETFLPWARSNPRLRIFDRWQE